MKRIISIIAFITATAIAFAVPANVQTDTLAGNLVNGFNTGAKTITAGDGGTITYSGTGTNNAKTLQTYTPATLPVSTAAQTALNAKATVFTLEQYGGGTGISDNSTAFQAAINAASLVGGTIQLGEGRYLIRGPVTVGNSVHIVGRGAKTILDGKYLLANGNGDGGLYYDSYLTVVSPLDPAVTVKTFSGALPAYTKSFTLNNVTGLSVGDLVWFEIGNDPTDPNEEQLRFIDQITAISGNTITVKTGTDEPVTGNPTTAGAHHCSRLLSAARNVSVENLSLDYLGINIYRSEGVRVSDVRIIEGTATFLVAEFNGLVIERVIADSIHGVNGPNGLPWYGWFIQGWGMRNMVVRDVFVKVLQGVSYFSCESQTRNVSIENPEFGALGGPIQFIPFACLVDLEYPISVKNLSVYSLDNGFLYSIGKTFKYDGVSFTSASGDRYFGINLADVTGPVRFKDSVYSNRTTVRRVLRPSASSAGSYDLGVTGLLSSMHVYCSTKTGLTGFVHYNGSGASPDFVSDMTAGDFSEYYSASDIGGPNQFSDIRQVYVTTNGSWPADGTIIVEAEVVRKTGDVVGVPELISGSGAPSASASAIGQEYYDRTNTRYWQAIKTGTGSSDWVPLFTLSVETLTGTTLPSSVTASSLTSFGASPTLATPSITNYLLVSSNTTNNGTGLFQTGNDTRFGSAFGADSSTLVLASNSSNNVGFVKSDIGGGDMLFGKGAFGAFTEWMRFVNGTGRVGIGTTTPGSLLDVNGTVTAVGFAGPLTGNVTGNVSGTSGSTTGNAATATALATARAINGVNFDGTAPITVAAAAGTLTGTTLASNVVTATIGTLTGLTSNGLVQTTGGTGALSVVTTTLPSSITGSSLTSTGTLTAVNTSGSVTTTVEGGTLAVKSGTNALAGTVTLSAGTATITSTAIDVNTVIVFSEKTAGGTPGLYQPLAAVSSGSAVVTSAATDTSTYNWVAIKVN